MTTLPADDLERRQATTTFDRNVVVTAGAGTGKTTLLVERCVNLLMRPSDPVQMTELVALTFTNKAANEMKARLRDRLEVLAGQRTGGLAAKEAEAAALDSLRERYSITTDDIHGRAGKALQQLERAQIGTIHSFAAALLRLYPLETGLNPQFREDDGRLRKRQFDTGWGLWLDEELSGTSPRTEEWKKILGRFSLDRLGELALALCADNVDLDGLQRPGGPDDPAGVLGQWLRGLEDAITDLIHRHPKQRRIEQALAVGRRVIQAARGGGASVDDEDLSLLRGMTAPKDWAQEDFHHARDLVTDVRALAQVDPVVIHRLCALLVPFARQCREDFARHGLVTFDGLLVRSRDLLRDHPRIREELKARFKAILVDEFQGHRSAAIRDHPVAVRGALAAGRELARHPSRPRQAVRGGGPQAIHLRFPGRRHRRLPAGRQGSDRGPERRRIPAHRELPKRRPDPRRRQRRLRTPDPGRARPSAGVHRPPARPRHPRRTNRSP